MDIKNVVQIRSVVTYLYLSDIPDLYANEKLCDRVRDILLDQEGKRSKLLNIKEAYSGFYTEWEWEGLTIEQAVKKTEQVLYFSIKRAMRELKIVDTPLQSQP